MALLKFLVIAIALGLCTASVQDAPVAYTDIASGIAFDTWSVGGLTFGMALPSNALTTDATEFVGMLTCASPHGQGMGWCGLGLGGFMTNNLLLMAWPDQNQVLTSFRWATDYVAPSLYTGDASLKQVSSMVNATHYSVIFRCRNCLQWSQGGVVGAAKTSEGYLVIGWCLAHTSPSNPSCPAAAKVARHESQGIFGATFDQSVAAGAYSAWAAKATATVAGNCGGPSTSSSATTTKSAAPSTMTTTSRVPAPTASGPANCAETYTVQPGEYCYLIAINHGLTLDQLYQINPGLVCDNLQIGRVLCVRGR